MLGLVTAACLPPPSYDLSNPARAVTSQLTQEGSGDVLGHLVPRAAGFGQVGELPVQHPLELWAGAGREEGPWAGLQSRSGSGGPLTLLEAISPTECRVCSVSS